MSGGTCNPLTDSARPVLYGLFEFPGIGHKQLLLKSRPQVCDERFEFGAASFSQAVINPVSSTAISDQAGPFQIGEVARDVGLRYSDDILNVAAAQLSGEQQVHDAQAVYVRKPFEIILNRSHRPLLAC